MLASHLFAYGRLKSDYSPPRSMKDPKKDYVRGYLFERDDHGKPDAALVEVHDDDQPWVEGQLMRVSKGELYELDKTESGYKRELTETRSGQAAWVYVWDGDVPPGSKRLTRWDTAEEKRRL